MITLELPLPPNVLHPNGRTRNYSFRAAMIRKAREEAGLVALINRPPTPWEVATVHATFYMPKRRDADGLVAWLKPYLDGIADAKVVVNDSVFRMGTIEQVTGKAAGRKVVLRIEER